jgi:hypothetical protein
MWAHIDSRAASAKAAKAAAAAAVAVAEATETSADVTVGSETATGGFSESLCFSSVLNHVASNVSVLCAPISVFE